MNAMKNQKIIRCCLLILILLVLFGSSRSSAQSLSGTGSLFTIDASASATTPETGYLEMGSRNANTSPDGHELTVNSRYLMLDNKPLILVMGEFHYSRYSEKYWEEEILKMKAGGIQIVATYIFWIHHEEIEGQFDWTAEKNLRRFVELCAKHGLYVYPRIGPWAHGEVRNGGLPDWLLTKCQTRGNDSIYLSYVQKFYNEIGKQLKGLLWKDGGPVIGIQLENEYANRAENGGAAHISKLKSMALEVGLDVPIFTVTGWDNAVVAPHIVIPVFGGYPDEPWDGSTHELVPDPENIYQFHTKTPSGKTGIMQGSLTLSENLQLSHYPKFTAELGGGIQITYHRRVVLSGDDIAAMAMTTLGSGVNLLGYYMYHGGTNPEGKLTTLQESQATGYPNDYPVLSYDFQAPLREFGQMHDSYRKLKILHQFIIDFGSDISQMNAILPNVVPTSPRDTSTLRIAARVKGNKGFLFFNNYLRNYPLPVQKRIQVHVKFQSEVITIPQKPIDIPSQSYFYWPMNMDLDGAIVKYATAQPFTKIDNGKTDYYFFIKLPGINAEFAFDKSTVKSFRSSNGTILHTNKQVNVNGIEPSTNVAIEFQTQIGKTVRIIVLSQSQAYNSWKIPLHGKDHLFITEADVFANTDTLYLRSRNPNAFSLSILPSVDDKYTSTLPFQKYNNDGAFDHYTASVTTEEIPVLFKQIVQPAQAPLVKMGALVDWRDCTVAMSPDDSTFSKAGTWRIEFPKNIFSDVRNVYIDINYTGDIGRLYRGTRLLHDNFFNGTTWEVGSKQFAPDVFSNGIYLKILPLRKDAPIYLPKSSWPEFKEESQVAKVNSITASPEYELKIVYGNNIK